MDFHQDRSSHEYIVRDRVDACYHHLDQKHGNEGVGCTRELATFGIKVDGRKGDEVSIRLRDGSSMTYFFDCTSCDL
jgi:hypothetical protein